MSQNILATKIKVEPEDTKIRIEFSTTGKTNAQDVFLWFVNDLLQLKNSKSVIRGASVKKSNQLVSYGSKIKSKNFGDATFFGGDVELDSLKLTQTSKNSVNLELEYSGKSQWLLILVFILFFPSMMIPIGIAIEVVLAIVLFSRWRSRSESAANQFVTFLEDAFKEHEISSETLYAGTDSTF